MRRRPLRGSVVVLVGASSGIGRAAALAFADRGAKLVLASRGGHALEDIAGACRARGAAALAVDTDVADAVAVDRLAEVAVQRFGRIDVWVHCASVLIVGDLDAHPADETRRLIDVNVTGCLNGSRAALRSFRRQHSGVLIIVSSLLGLVPNPLAPVYVTSKFATRGLALTLRQAVTDEPDIHVCSILPGPTDTPIFERAANHVGRQLRAIPPAHSAERVAALIVSRARRPRRESTTGLINHLLLVGHRLSPRSTDRLVARWSARLLTGPGPAEHGSGTLFAAPDHGRIDGGFRRSRLRRRMGDAVGWRLARRSG